MSTSPNYLVATDLDGTLLDHDSYSWQAAEPSLLHLQESHIPIVVNTSKTFAEVKDLQTELGLKDPFIVENGSAIYIPTTHTASNIFTSYDTDHSRLVLGEIRSHILDILNVLRTTHGWQFEGYSDWSVQDVMAQTGLSLEAATRSLERQFSEPIIWKDSDINYQKFEQAINEKQLRIIRGGRFLHILGKSDKGKALATVTEKLKHIFKKDYTVIALGDTHNDLDMLNSADIPVFVKSPAHEFPLHKCKNTPIFTTKFGPSGWHEAITTILKKSGANHG